MQGDESRWLGLADRTWLRLLLAALFAVFSVWSFAGSVLLASASMLTLEGDRHDVTLDVASAHRAALQQIAQGQPGSLPGDPARYQSAWLVLDDVALTAAGARGGYFYKIYLMSTVDAQASEQQLAGMLGPFEIAAARQQGEAALRYGLGSALAAYGGERMARLVVSFRRAGGVTDGALIKLGGVRVELSTEPGN